MCKAACAHRPCTALAQSCSCTQRHLEHVHRSSSASASQQRCNGCAAGSAVRHLSICVQVLAQHVQQVVGIDNNAANIVSAKTNAATNGFDNCSFVLGTAEEKIDSVLQLEAVQKAEEVVAVVDPPRGGALRPPLHTRHAICSFFAHVFAEGMQLQLPLASLQAACHLSHRFLSELRCTSAWLGTFSRGKTARACAPAPGVQLRMMQRPASADDVEAASVLHALLRQGANAHSGGAGLHRNVLYALLGCDKVKKVVYVSCNPDSLVNDLRILFTPAKAARRRHNAPDKGPPKRSAPHFYTAFRPVRACPVDMFPHTGHVEMVVLLERDSQP
jgi:Methyltransferase domain